MKSGILVGAIAGVAAGIVAVACSYIFAISIGIFEPPGGSKIWDISLIRLFAVAHFSLDMIWSIIFGAVYAMLYGSIPGKGVVKGLYFGLLIWMIKDIAAGSYTALIALEIDWAFALILIGFFMWIAYGLVLGYLYKPTK
jgi:hypothetical protein